MQTARHSEQTLRTALTPKITVWEVAVDQCWIYAAFQPATDRIGPITLHSQ